VTFSYLVVWFILYMWGSHT